MSQTKKAVIQVAVLLFVFGLITWHAVYWHSTGMYLEIFSWVETDKIFLPILYNLGLMLVLGTVLGLLMEKITDLVALIISEYPAKEADSNE